MMIRFVKFLCLFAFFAQPVFSQQEIRKEQVPGTTLQHLLQPSDMPADEARREAELMRLIDLYSFSSFQVMQVCNTLRTEKARLDFALSAYPYVIDPDEFHIVYDVFSKLSTVIRLYDLIKKVDSEDGLNVNLCFNYPDWKNYSGPENCPSIISEEDFHVLYDQLTALKSDNDRMSMAVSIVKNNCVSVSYVMKYALTLNNEELRLGLIKASFPHLFDVNNLTMASQVFHIKKNRDSFLRYVREQSPTHGYDPLPPVQYVEGCVVKDKDFADIIILLKKQDINNTRLSMAKQTIISGKCFTVKQLLQILQLFEYESSKVEIAKFATDYCIEPDKCYLLTDCFEFESSKREFLTFLGSR